MCSPSSKAQPQAILWPTLLRDSCRYHRVRRPTSGQNPKRTNIEAARAFPAPSTAIRGSSRDTPVMMWGARGGKDYAGRPGPCQSVWVRWAPFDSASGAVDEAQMTQRELINLGDDGEWRALSSLDMVGDTVYFTAAYDGELGHAVDVTDTARAGRANSAAFKSLVGKWDLGRGSALLCSAASMGSSWRGSAWWWRPRTRLMERRCCSSPRTTRRWAAWWPSSRLCRRPTARTRSNTVSSSVTSAPGRASATRPSRSSTGGPVVFARLQHLFLTPWARALHAQTPREAGGGCRP